MTPFIILLLIVVVISALLFFIYHLLFRHPVRKRPDPHRIPASSLYKEHKEKMLRVAEDMATTPHEPLELVSYDGHRLRARLYRFSKEPQPIVLFFHGYHGTAEWDGFGVYQICKKLGYSILMPDMRAHGKSEGDITFGIRERHDIKQWVSYVLERFGSDTKIILAGVSMGATSVLAAAGETQWPPNVIGIVSDCAFSHPSGLLRPLFEEKHLPYGFLFSVMRLTAKLFGGFNLIETSAIDAVSKIQLPILFIHGARDIIVPVSMCHDLYEACTSDKQKLIMDSANHANCAMTDFPTYEQTVVEYIHKHL